MILFGINLPIPEAIIIVNILIIIYLYWILKRIK